MIDPDVVLRDGPWEHQMITANGTRLHAAVAGDERAPLVVLLHGFPQCWYAWRAQIPALAEAGYRVAALDLRGYGASDRPPGRFDLPTLCADVAGVVRSLGTAQAVVIGHGLGAQVAWSMPNLTGAARAIAVLGTPHPALVPQIAARSVPVRTARWLARIQVPWFPEQALVRGTMVNQVLQEWSAEGWDRAAQDLYTQAMRLPFAAHSAMEQLRWLVRSTPRADGRAFRRAVRRPIPVPVLSLHGRADGFLPPRACHRDPELVRGEYERVVIDGAGHFLPEEAPTQVTGILRRWLALLTPA